MAKKRFRGIEASFFMPSHRQCVPPDRVQKTQNSRTLMGQFTAYHQSEGRVKTDVYSFVTLPRQSTKDTKRTKARAWQLIQ